MDIVDIPFTRGLNTEVDFLSCPKGHCLTFSDYQLDYGILNPRTSFNQVNSTFGAGKVMQVCAYTDIANSTSRPWLIASDGTRILRSNGSFIQSSEPGYTFTDITGGVTFGAPNFFSTAILNGILMIANGTTSAIKLDSLSVNATNQTVNQANNAFITVNNIMFAGVNGTSRVYWSNVSDPTTWGVSNFIDFRSGDGDVVRALGELNGQLLIFKRNSIGILQTTTQTISGAVTLGPLSTLFEGVGCFIDSAVTSLPDGRCAFFSSNGNLYLTDGSTLMCLNDKAPDSPSVKSPLINMGFSIRTKVLYYPPRNELFIIGRQNPILIFAYDLNQGYWRQITGMNKIMGNACSVFGSQSTNFQTSAILIGNSDGNIIDIARDNNRIPTDQDGVAVTPSASTSIVLPFNFFNWNHQCLTIIYKSSNPLTFAYGFDNTYGSDQTAPAANNRVDLKIGLKVLSNSQRPTTFQIKFKDTGGASVYKVFLSDQMTA